MDFFHFISVEKRFVRHMLFWLGWIIGFTFIKSFGDPIESYLAWLCYYLVTLPIFMAHTYLIVYWAAGKFLKGSAIILFIIVFILLLILFSFIELLISEEFLSAVFPEVFSDKNSYTDLGNIIISGVGNLYIILVFTAAKMMREWYISDHHQQEIRERSLYLQRADVNSTVQPGMLLYTIEKIEALVKMKSEKVPEAIALLSDLLNTVMQAQRNKVLRVDEEARNVKKMLKLYTLLLNIKIPQLRIEGDNLSMKSLPGFILFSPIEICCRYFGADLNGDILIKLTRSEQAIIEFLFNTSVDLSGVSRRLSQELEGLYPNRFQIESHHSNQHLEIIITANNDPEEEQRSVN